MKNGILDFLRNERKEGRIRNLGFSYHGDIKVFDYLLSRHDEYKWDFAQIQLNYLDWKHAKATNERNTDAEYLYHELEKRNIPAVIMEPLLGGRLAKVPDYAVADMKQRDPDRSVASWAFRFAGSFPGVHTVLSGMTEMEHLKDNLRSLAPLKPLTDDDFAFLERIATKMVAIDTIPCNDCKYCMPCPYGIDIPPSCSTTTNASTMTICRRMWAIPITARPAGHSWSVTTAACPSCARPTTASDAASARLIARNASTYRPNCTESTGMWNS